MSDALTALVSIISSNVKDIQSLYQKENIEIPSLDEPFSPNALDDNPQVTKAIKLVTAAAAQLIATLGNPSDTVRELTPSMYLSATIGFVVDVDVPDILAEKPLEAKEIAKIASVDPNHMARVLRYLATRHVFREVSPDVFANNRVSSAMIKANKKSVAELKADPSNKYDDAGLAAYVGHITAEGLKSAPYLIDYLKSGGKSAATPFNIAYPTEKTLWEWYAKPENSWRMRQFVGAMTDHAKLFKDEIWISAIGSLNLGPNDVVVDIGGNMGTVTLALAKAFEKPQFVIQDLEQVVPVTKQFWESAYPEALSSGRVRVEVQDFFAPQSIKKAAVYFLRFVLHDWAHDECVKILRQLKDAAGPKSKLVLFELCVPYACPNPSGYPSSPGMLEAPYPLLPNLGQAGRSNPSSTDIQMMNVLKGEERSVGQFIELGQESGWKLDSVRHDEMSTFIFSVQN